MNNQELEQFIKKVRKESFLKSLIFAGAVAFIGCFITAIVCYFADFSAWWISLIVMAVLLIAVTPLAYFVKYRPSVKDVARRLDRLGLYEQIITMTELEGDDSIMAVHQRESAKKALKGVTTKMLGITVSALSIVALAVSATAGVAATTVHALSREGVAPSGKDLIDSISPDPEVYYTVRYEVGYYDNYGNPVANAYGCEIDGNDEQVILAGTDAEAVYANIVDEGGEDWVWVFYGWFDEIDFTQDPLSQDPYRQDLAVDLTSGVITEEDGEIVITHTAVFIQAQLSDDGDGESGEGDGEEGEGDKPSDAPGEGEDGEGDGEGEDGDGEGSDGVSGGGDSNENQIIDGDTNYRERYEEYYNQYLEYLANGGEIPDYLREFIEAYYNTIL